jgi:ABC-type oligopeptide transport system substrate-binding subunit
MNRKLWRILGMFFVLFALGSVLLAACGIQDTATNNNGGSTPTPNVGGSTPAPNGGGSGNCGNGTVHTLLTTFQESCVNVAKGSNLQVIASVTSFHILTNGSWVNGNQVPMNEAGAPTVNNVQVTSGTISIGPFTTAGTYHIFCTVHPNMNLTVIVK